MQPSCWSANVYETLGSIPRTRSDGCAPVIPALERWKQEDQKSKSSAATQRVQAILCYMKPYLKGKKNSDHLLPILYLTGKQWFTQTNPSNLLPCYVNAHIGVCMCVFGGVFFLAFFQQGFKHSCDQRCITVTNRIPFFGFQLNYLENTCKGLLI